MASILRVNTLTDASSNNSVPMATVSSGSAKAWVQLNGTGTIAARDSFNHSSLTDGGVGRYKNTISSAMGNDDYVVHATGDIGSVSDFAVACSNDSTTARTTTAAEMRIGTTGGASADTDIAAMSFFGDLA
tara:strand:+ start:349 stop:741 length:393 start_codon:yes stop_codon:yes gene_type:complete